MTYPPPILTRVLAWLRPLAASLRPIAAEGSRLAGWFVLTQGVTVVAMLFVIAGFWSLPDHWGRLFGPLVSGVCLFALEWKVSGDRASTRDP